MLKNIVVAGYPKSGTTYLTKLLSDLLDSPIEGFLDQPSHEEIAKTKNKFATSEYGIYKAHQTINDLRISKTKIFRTIYIVRDPRDVIISGANFFNKPKHQLLYPVGVRDSLEAMTKNVIYGGRLPWCQTKWSEHVIEYLRPSSDKIILRYEDLINDPLSSLKKISKFLNVSKKDNELNSIIKDNDIEKKRNEAILENNEKYLRYLGKGKVGEWKTTLTEKQIDEVERHLHSVMTVLNYEINTKSDKRIDSLSVKKIYRKEKYVLCRPQGGLNDMLCQIEKCCQYAEQNNRTVIVDSNYFASSNFNDDLDKYFYSKQTKLFLSIRNYSEVIEGMSVFPHNLMGKINSYDAYYNLDKRSFCDKINNQPLTFDFNRSYVEDVLIHHTGGGGSLSKEMMLRMGLNKNILKELLTRVKSIKSGWVGVHVRNTDYESNYIELINFLQKQNFEKIFLATDSAEVKRAFKSSLVNKKIYSFASFLSEDGSPIHKNARHKTDIFNRNQDAILDLLMLALSQKLYFTQIKKTETSGSYSGYSILAQNLWKSKIYLKYLLNDDGVRFGLN